MKEYLFVRLHIVQADTITKEINIFARAGWRVVSHSEGGGDYTFVFEREAQEQTMTKQSGWLLTAGTDPPRYFNAHRLTVDTFTTDVNSAIRFARFIDAETVRCWLFERVVVKSTQHYWMGDKHVTEGIEGI